VKTTCVIGGGLTGLIHAWRAHKSGDSVTVFESGECTGGVLQSKNLDGYLLDYGANTLNLRSKDVADIMEELGILGHAIEANQEANLRFIVRDGRLVSLPHDFSSFLTSSFLSPLGKLRLLCEPFIAKGKKKDETVADFISRRLGKEALTYAGNPFLSGIYAAKPESLSLPHAFPGLQELEQVHGSVFKGMIKSKKNPNRLPKTRLISFPQGMQELPSHISNQLPDNSIRLQSKVLKIEKRENKWRVVTQGDNSSKGEVIFDRVICSIPAHQLMSIDWNGLHKKELIEHLADAKHYPLALVYHGYEKENISHPLNGFGFLVPAVEKRKILGTLFSSTIFPGRAPKNKVLLTTFVGGERQPELTEWEDEKIHNMVKDEHTDLLGTSKNPSFKKIIRWPKAIPLPDQSMQTRKQAALKLEEQNPGLIFTGSHLCGPPLPNCLQADMV